VDNNVAALESRLYSPYGDPFGQTGSSQTPFGFTGEPTDSNGLLYLRARYYNPALGVFPSLDPLEGGLGQPMSLNRYMWVQGQVVNAVDPSGLCKGDPCNPNDPNRDAACWDIAAKLYSDYGITIRSRLKYLALFRVVPIPLPPDITLYSDPWSLSEIKTIQQAFSQIATKLGKQDPTLGAAIWRYRIGKDHPKLGKGEVWEGQLFGAKVFKETNTIVIQHLPDLLYTVVHEVGHLVQDRENLQSSFEQAIKGSDQQPVSIRGEGKPGEDFPEAWTQFILGSVGTNWLLRPMGSIRQTFFEQLVNRWFNEAQSNNRTTPTFSWADGWKAYGCEGIPKTTASDKAISGC
jgi:RHS repeat-associated protein